MSSTTRAAGSTLLSGIAGESLSIEKGQRELNFGASREAPRSVGKCFALTGRDCLRHRYDRRRLAETRRCRDRALPTHGVTETRRLQVDWNHVAACIGKAPTGARFTGTRSRRACARRRTRRGRAAPEKWTARLETRSNQRRSSWDLQAAVSQRLRSRSVQGGVAGTCKQRESETEKQKVSEWRRAI